MSRLADDAPHEIALRDLPNLAAPYGQHLCHAATFGLELPYAALGGPGFERLCFHLLLLQGKQPRFFGRAGEAQFGIDLIVSDGERTQVYQCKNKAIYTVENLRADLDLFAKKWLHEQPDLPRPDHFILCCTAKIDVRGEWEIEKHSFFLKHGVTVEEWHRDTLNVWLHQQPDIVADLFGDDVAERFCERDGWNDGLFRPLLPGSGEKDIERFLELRTAGRLVHEPATVTRFSEIVAGQQLVLLEGLSGNGKTMAALDLATSFDKGGWRVFFISLRNGGDEQQLFEGIKDRCIRPTLLILDDCHRDFATIERVVSRARRALYGRAFGFVLTAQTASEDAEGVNAEGSDFVEELRESLLAIRIAPTVEQYRNILGRARPALSGLSHKSIERLYSLTAHDLAVLDILLEAIEDRALSDTELLADLFPGVLRRYFGHEKVHAPHLKSLAAVAQYDIAVPVSMLPHPFEVSANWSAVERLTIRVGQPAKGQPTSLSFIHASAAELIFRALCWVDADPNWPAITAREIVSHLNSLVSAEEFFRGFDLFLRGRLRLSDDSDLKHAALASIDLSRRLVDQSETMPLRVLSQVTFLTRSVGVTLPYSEMLTKRIKRIAADSNQSDRRDLPLMGSALRSMALADPKRHAALEGDLGTPILRLIRANGTIFELFKILASSTPSFAAGLIAALDPSAVAELIEKTIAEGRSIGTLHLALRELAEREMPDGCSQLADLEAHLGGAPILRLIRANGTIFELFKILEYSTPGFAAQLIAALDPPAVTELIDKTIAEGRSIGTLNLALRELAEREMPDGASQLAALEAYFGGEPILRLIRANGTIFELLMTLKYSTPGFAAGLIAALDPPAVAELIEKTITEGRSIGTLHLALRELAEREMPDGVSQLAALEAHLGGAPILRLIRVNGTIPDLFRILHYSTPGFAAGLIAALDAPAVTELINKTIAVGRSIGTLNFAFRELHRTNPISLAKLEHLIDVSGFWQLVLGVGDLNDLAYLLDDLSLPFRERVLAPEYAPSITGWLQLARRGGLYAISRFIKDSVDGLPSETRDRFAVAADEVLPEIVETSSWTELRIGLSIADQLRHRPLVAKLEAAAFSRIDNQHINKLAFDSFIEAANGLSCLWSWRDALQPTLGKRFWELLPGESTWPSDYSFFIGGRYLLEIARSTHVSDVDLARLLRSFCTLSSAAEIEKTQSKPLRSFIWSLFDLWKVRGKSFAETFADLQPKEFWDRVEVVVTAQAEMARLNPEKLDILALAGLLTFVLSGHTKRLAHGLRGKIKGVEWLVDEADELEFVPSVLAIRGLSLIDPYQARFSSDRRRRLLAKAHTGKEGGPAVDFLCHWLRRDDRFHQPVRY